MGRTLIVLAGRHYLIEERLQLALRPIVFNSTSGTDGTHAYLNVY